MRFDTNRAQKNGRAWKKTEDGVRRSTEKGFNPREAGALFAGERIGDSWIILEKSVFSRTRA